MSSPFNVRARRESSDNELYPDYPEADRTSYTSSTTPMLRDVDTMQQQHQHRSSRRRRDDASAPPSPSSPHLPPPPRLQQASRNSSATYVHYQPPHLQHLHSDPVSPFSSSPSRSPNGTPSPFDPTPGIGMSGMSTGESNVSLAVNYIPSKFSNPQIASLVGGSLYSGPRRRKGGGEKPRRRSDVDDDLGPGVVPKMGGGVDAFKSGESRIGGQGDEDEDEDEVDEVQRDQADEASRTSRGWFSAGRGGSHTKHARKARWNGFKWVLFCANLLLTLYSFTALIFCLLTWFNVWDHADVIRAGNHTELVLSTLAATAGILTSLIGWVGILMNNRSFLAIYTFLLWVVFIFILVPGYITYKRHTFNLEGKINAQWSKALRESGRLRIQNQLQCCGYFSPFVEATISQTCYARSTLPGCKSRYLVFEKRILKWWYIVAFGLVPAHVGVMVAGLLCSNHVTYRFGKGMMPKAYRLSMGSMAVIMDNYATQLAEQYGAEIATDVISRSRSNLKLDVLPTVPNMSYVPSSPSLSNMSNRAQAGSVVLGDGERRYDALPTNSNSRPGLSSHPTGSGSGSGSRERGEEGENTRLMR